MNKQQKQKMFLALLMANALFPDKPVTSTHTPKKTKTKVLPKGTYVYHFTKNGTSQYTRNDKTVFSCIARNDQNAFRKFRNFCMLNSI